MSAGPVRHFLSLSDAGGGLWAHRPKDKIAIDPVLGATAVRTPVVGAVILQLAQEGKLRLDDGDAQVPVVLGYLERHPRLKELRAAA